jgi:hypothetical protein
MMQTERRDRAFPSGGAQNGLALQVLARGLDVLSTPLLNRGTAFTPEQRQQLCLTGLLPSGVLSLADQVRRAYAQYQRQPDDLSKHIALTALHDRNEVLFYRLLSEHLREMLPIVYTPTVGAAIERYSHDYRRPRGVYLSINEPEAIESGFRNFGAGADDIDLIVATDAEQILGIGDWGVGLDPQVGYLHALRPGRPALALDLMEELRAPVVDRLALTLVNRRQVRPTEFVEHLGGAVYLGDEARRRVITAYQERKQEEIFHQALNRKMPLGLVPHVQARLLARHLRGDVDVYVPYVHR